MSKLEMKIKVTKRWSFYPVALVGFMLRIRMPINWIVKIDIDPKGKLNA